MTRFTPQYVRQLEQRLKQLETQSYAPSMQRQERMPMREKQIRIARTTAKDFAYPSGSSSKYEIEFGTPSFEVDSLAGQVGFEPYKVNDRFRVAGLLEASSIDEGDLVHVCLCHGQWYIIQAGIEGSSLIVEFEIVDAGYDTGSDDGTCENQSSGPEGDVLAEVLQSTTCNLAVPGRNEDGYITLTDKTGFFTNRSPSELVGKNGFAARMCDGYEWSWKVIWIDWFRKRQVVTDWRKTPNQIIVEFENHWVWNHCELPDYTLDLLECPEDEYDGGCS